jgi:uncharacterized protein (DUF433 family)
MNWREHISVDPTVCHGKACVRGTRILVAVVLANLAEGRTPQEIIDDYPGLTSDSIRATIAYAAELAQERHLDVPA